MANFWQHLPEGELMDKEPAGRKTIGLATAGLIAVILVLAQLLITTWTVHAASEDEIVAYVSFSGTLTSMLLAVLAIVYSYYTTASQKTDADRISTQVGSLTATAQTLSASELRLADELKRLEEIRAKLDGLDSHFQSGKADTANLTKMVRELAVAHSKRSEVEEGLAPPSDQSMDTANAVDAQEGQRESGDAAIERNGPADSSSSGQLDTPVIPMRSGSSIAEFIKAHQAVAERFALQLTSTQCLPIFAAYKCISEDIGIQDAFDRYYKPFITPARTEISFISDSAYGEIYAYTLTLLDLLLAPDSPARTAFREAFSKRLLMLGTSEKPDSSLAWEKVVPFLHAEAEKLK